MISCLASLLVSLFLITQQELFPKDEYGKYTLMEIIEVPDYTQEQLFNNASSWAKDTFKKPINSRDTAAWSITASGSFTVHNVGSLKKHPDGAVEFEFTIEIKEARYRYIITNYKFIPYERDRYAKFVPQNSKSVPLESYPSAMNKANWNSYLKTAHAKSLALIDQLSQAVMTPDVQTPKKVKRNDSW
ncbi:MAG: DUF4468 domain-containing protein [Cyclobacteriaceae bacterium]|nr:DUF4468 domain-containing protein [Cyclobacteriaceae bacterium]